MEIQNISGLEETPITTPVNAGLIKIVLKLMSTATVTLLHQSSYPMKAS
jgi:hypothetical protein